MKKGWETATLGDTCEMYQPKTISGKDMVEGGAYPVFGANGIIGRYDKFNHEDPQLLITCRGATCGSVNISEPNSWITGNAMVVRSSSGSIDRSFLEYLFRGGLDVSKAITGAAQPQITRTNLEPLEISYPVNLAEQQRIVGILDEAFAGLATAKANAEKNLQNARALFESHLQSVFSHPGKDWVKTTLKTITAKIGSGATPRGGQAAYKAEGVSLIRSLNVHDLEFKYAKLAFIDDMQADSLSNVEIQPRDVLLNITGASVARCCIAPDDVLPARVNQHVSIIRPLKDKLDANFLHYLLISKPYKELLLKTGEGGATRQAITKAQIQNFSIEYPETLIEQRSVADQLDSIQKETQRLAANYERKLAALEELKKALLHQAFSGEL